MTAPIKIVPTGDLDDETAELADDIVNTAQPTEEQPPPELDDFDDLRLDQNFAAGGARKLITVIPVRKPSRQQWVKVHPDPGFRRDMSLLELKDADREVYAVTASAAPYATDEIFPVTLYTAITKQGALFLWPCRLPGADGRDMDWYRSARLAAAEAMKSWVRVTANMQAGSYDTAVPLVDYGAATWPDMSFRQILEIAFRGRLIKSSDHPALLRLQGRV